MTLASQVEAMEDVNALLLAEDFAGAQAACLVAENDHPGVLPTDTLECVLRAAINEHCLDPQFQELCKSSWGRTEFAYKLTDILMGK